MPIRPATPADIPAILAIEHLPQYRAFVGRWDAERHHAALTGPDARYFVMESDPGESASGASESGEKAIGNIDAYAILRGFAESPLSNIELKRIAVRTPERGLGRKFLSDLIRIVFDEHHAHRLFLDVFESNTRARHLYESLGFVYEGTLREAALVDGKYHSLRLMSLLDREYQATKPKADH